MKRSSPLVSLRGLAERHRERPFAVRKIIAIADLKARQSEKIRQLGDALIAAGFHGLDDQAKALGLSRSTTWTILKASHKSSGLSAAIINRMLAAPKLPPRVKLKIYEYIEEKSAGLYGDGRAGVRKFTTRVSSKLNQIGSP